MVGAVGLEVKTRENPVKAPSSTMKVYAQARSLSAPFWPGLFVHKGLMLIFGGLFLLVILEGATTPAALQYSPRSAAPRLSFAYLKGDNYCGSRGTVRVPMLVRILRTYRLPEILMLAAATLCVVVVVAYWSGG
jgi:hypothetical protein